MYQKAKYDLKPNKKAGIGKGSFEGRAASGLDPAGYKQNMTALTVAPDELLVCVDDTGHEGLAPGHTFYGLGGCAVLGRDCQSLIEQPWRAIRRAVGVSDDTALHASEFGQHSTAEQLEMVSLFFAERPFMRFGAAGVVTTVLPHEMPLMWVVLEALKRRIVDVARYSPFRSIAVVFEHNQRANPLIERYFGDFRMAENGESLPVECYFMPKRAIFPALEVADFIANAIGGHARRGLSKRGGFGKDFRAVFHSVDPRLVSYIGIQSVTIGSTPSAL